MGMVMSNEAAAVLSPGSGYEPILINVVAVSNYGSENASATC
jgi:hypothetical protein